MVLRIDQDKMLKRLMGFGGLQSSVNPPASTYLKPAVPGSHPKHTIYAISTQSQILYYICHFVEE